MSNRAFMFFNHPYVPHEDYRWNDFDKNPDTTKLAMVCHDSWRRRGWQVERLSSERWNGLGFTPFTGQLKESLEQYPLEFFNFWYEALNVVKIHGPSWFFTIDVLNHTFSPQQADFIVRQAQVSGFNCATVQNMHFSCSCIWLTEEYIRDAIAIITAYDCGVYQKLPSSLVSDETVLRSYSKYFHWPMCSYMFVEPGWQESPLTHCSKSVLERYTKKAVQWPEPAIFR